MRIGKQSSCLTVETGEWVCPKRKPLGKRLRSISNRYRRDRDTRWEPPKTPTTTKGMADVTTALAPTLTAADRCDRCGAQAYVRARLISGGELLFCAHHGREHLPKLHDITTKIEDETERLLETSTSASVGER